MNKMVQDVLASFKTVLFRHAIFSLCVVTLIFCLQGFESSLIWAAGCAWGFIDTLMMFNGVRKGMALDGEKSLQEMHRTLLKRLAFAVILVMVMLKLKSGVFGVFMGFILSHIFLLCNLIIIAGRKR